jgi:UDP-2,3-diacylglucosamine pyrophosphatase LpxH
MTSIRWVCISDLHLGALNSLLTNVTSDGERCDNTCSSPVLTALCECLRSLRTPGQDPPELVVLGDLFELALTAPEDAAGAFSQFIEGLRPGKPDGAVAPGFRFVPGNHDHHLWSRASDDRYLRVLASDATSIPAPRDRHATHLLPSNDTEPVRDRFVEILAARGGAADGVSVIQSYPNLGLVSASGDRSVILSHGHFIEPLYRMMSVLDTVFGSPRKGTIEAWQLEADNGGWIDFFWSSMGDSGDIMRVTRSLYESLQSTQTIHAEIDAIERAIKKAGASRIRADTEAHAVAELLKAGIGTAMRERHRGGIVLSPHAQEGLGTFLNGPVATQVTAEIGTPTDVTFVFGHTHKPFVESRAVPAFPMPVSVVNTGGWVVDTPQPNPLKGASLILIDDELNVASVCCYTEGADASSYRVRIDPARPDGPNALVDQLRSAIDADREPWSSLGQAIRTTVVERSRQLAERLKEDASALDQLNQPDQDRKAGADPDPTPASSSPAP